MQALACAVLVLQLGLASSEQPFEIWPKHQIPDERPGVFGPETAVPGPGGDLDLMIHNVTVPTLTPFELNSASPTPAVIVAPGGGYSILAWNREGTAVAKWLNSVGVAAFILKYRVPGRSWLDFGAAPLQDAQRAFGVLRSRASEFNVDPNRIGFVGFSAGGNLVAHHSTSFSTRSYDKVDKADDESCRPDASLMIYPWKLVEDDMKTLAFNVTKDHPPAILVSAEDDPTAPIQNPIMYYLALKTTKAPPSELHTYPRGGHGFGLCTITNVTAWHAECTWPDRAALFLHDLWNMSTTAQQ